MPSDSCRRPLISAELRLALARSGGRGARPARATGRMKIGSTISETSARRQLIATIATTTAATSTKLLKAFTSERVTTSCTPLTSLRRRDMISPVLRGREEADRHRLNAPVELAAQVAHDPLADLDVQPVLEDLDEAGQHAPSRPWLATSQLRRPRSPLGIASSTMTFIR